MNTTLLKLTVSGQVVYLIALILLGIFATQGIMPLWIRAKPDLALLIAVVVEFLFWSALLILCGRATR